MFVIVGILTGKACGGANFCSAPKESSYVNLRDPDIQRFLKEEVIDLNCEGCTLGNSRLMSDHHPIKKNQTL